MLAHTAASVYGVVVDLKIGALYLDVPKSVHVAVVAAAVAGLMVVHGNSENYTESSTAHQSTRILWFVVARQELLVFGIDLTGSQPAVPTDLVESYAYSKPKLVAQYMHAD